MNSNVRGSKRTSIKIPTRIDIAGGVLASLVILSLGVFDLRQTLTLLRSESMATAKVVGYREGSNRGAPVYQVRYVFSPDPGAREFKRMDFLGLSYLWFPLAKADWEKAIETKQLAVRFDPENPANNAPVLSPPSLRQPAISIIIGGIIFAITLGVARRRRRLLKEQAV